MVSVAAPVTTIKWVKPSPLWDLQASDMPNPFLVEFDGDSFMSDFLDLMGGKVPDKSAANLSEHAVKPTDGSLKLYQPLHGSYYLVTGSLVCRQLGLPDHTVNRKKKEKVSFVLRQKLQVNGQGPLVEHGWVDNGPQKGWQPVAANKLLPNEERQPLHPVKVQPPPLSGTPSFKDLRANTVAPADQRIVYHGYIPVASREKYLVPNQNAAQSIQGIIDHPQLGDPTIGDPRLDEVEARVIGAWRAMYVYLTYNGSLSTEHTFSPDPSPAGTPPGPNTAPTQDIEQQISLNVIVDLGDFLKRNLSSVSDAIVNGTSLPSGSTKRQALLTELQNIMVITNDPANPQITLADAVNKLSNSANLARAENGSSPDTYNLFNAPLASGGNVDGNYLAPLPQPPSPTNAPPEGQLHIRFREALQEEKAANPNTWLHVPDEIGNMIKDEPVGGNIYWLRLVYEHDPCDPVVSDPSDTFSFAKVFDPDAPARKVRIELPSIKLKDLRKYKRGIGMQMSPELGDVLNKVNSSMLSGGGLLDTGSQLGITLICSFSIPIITICALIVMFIFLILFNIIFWWLPFIRICFPIPTRKSGG